MGKAHLPKTIAKNIGERIAKKVEGFSFKIESGELLNITVSIGIAQYDGVCGPKEVLSIADKMMYRAKALGKNRVYMADMNEC